MLGILDPPNRTPRIAFLFLVYELGHLTNSEAVFVIGSDRNQKLSTSHTSFLKAPVSS